MTKVIEKLKLSLWLSLLLILGLVGWVGRNHQASYKHVNDNKRVVSLAMAGTEESGDYIDMQKVSGSSDGEACNWEEKVNEEELAGCVGENSFARSVMGGMMGFGGWFAGLRVIVWFLLGGAMIAAIRYLWIKGNQ